MTRQRKPSPDDLPIHSEPTESSTPARPRHWQVTLTDTTRRTFVINTDSQPERTDADLKHEQFDFCIRGRVMYTTEEHLERWAEIALLSDE